MTTTRERDALELGMRVALGFEREADTTSLGIVLLRTVRIPTKGLMAWR